MKIFKIIGLSDSLIQAYIESTAPVKRGISKHQLKIEFVNIRNYMFNRKVDSRPFGGGAGLLMRIDVLYKAIQSNLSSHSKIVIFDPRGEKWTQARAKEYALKDEIIFVCGRYEGIDSRIYDLFPQAHRISLGDFILTQGELVALDLMDSIIRLIPGMCDSFESTQEESFSLNSIFEYNQYTKPRVFKKIHVPEVLLEGHHGKIIEWRFKNGLKNLIKNRPEEIKTLNLKDKQGELILKSMEEYYYGNK